MSIVEPGFNIGVKSNKSRKKKSSKTGDTTESDSVNIKEEFLVKETSFDYGEDGATVDGDLKQTPKSSKIQTKRMLGKPLGKINFLSDNDNDNILLNKSVEKLVVVRKLFSKINGFWRVSTLSKFVGIVRAMFTSELSLMKVTKLATDAKILVNTDLKKSSGHSDWAVVVKKISVGTSVEAVCAVLFEFGIIKSVKMQLTCVIDCYPITYARTRCVIVCFGSAESLDAVMGVTPVLRGAHLCWSYLGSTVYAKCDKVGYTSLSCASGRKISSGSLSCRVLLDTDKNRLAAIYAKCLAPVFHPVTFGGMSWVKIAGGSLFSPLSVHSGLVNFGSSLGIKPILSAIVDIEKKFTILESSLTSLVKQISELAKRLDSLMLAVSQPSPECQLLVTSLSQNQVGDIVMGEGSGETTSDETATKLNSFIFSEVKRLKTILKGLSVSVLSLTISLIWKIATCNIRSMNNSAKQENIVYWHLESGNIVSVVIKAKLKASVGLWIKNKFEGVRIFTSGLDKGFLGAGMAIIINSVFAQHVSKIEEISGQIISVCLLFKNKLSVTFLGLYTGASAKTWFSQASGINFFIFRAINTSFFVVLSGNFNENKVKRCASFRKCLEVGLINLLNGFSASKSSTWSNLCEVLRVIDYVFVNEVLASAIVRREVTPMSKFFDTDHKMVGISVELGGLVDVCLNNVCKQTNKNQWKFKINNMDVAKWVRFKELSLASLVTSLGCFLVTKEKKDLDEM
ncbi:hypothetical protein G9A89_014206 [Geosiphon pyriformis]|nr:hypothetical protein G9A89_014206 [Geosiphon pyriformis]